MNERNVPTAFICPPVEMSKKQFENLDETLKRGGLKARKYFAKKYIDNGRTAIGWAEKYPDEKYWLMPSPSLTMDNVARYNKLSKQF